MNVIVGAPIAGFVIAAILLRILLHPPFAIALDRPNRRSLHATPVPRTGGLAMIAGIAVAAGWLAPGLPLTVWGALAVLVGISFADDLRGVPVTVRLACHLGATAATALALLGHDAGVLPVVLVALAMTWMINVYNFMDGSDGMAGGMTLIGFAAYAWLYADAGHGVPAAFALAVAASAAAFLLFNFPPARIFMGDAGAVPLGFLAAVLGLDGWRRGLWPLWLPPLVFSPFLIDASVTLVRRIGARQKFWEAHHDHYYQRVIRMGSSHRRVALAAYVLMGGAALLAAVLVVRGPGAQIGGIALWCALFAALFAGIDLCWRRHRDTQRGC